VEEGKFREDLYFRLNVFPIELPPLREHPEDLIPLARHFVKQLNRELNKEIKGLSFSSEKKLVGYDWPGNIRELKNVIERAMLLCQGDLIQAEDLLLERKPETVSYDLLGEVPSKDIPLEEMEKLLVIRALEKTGWNQTQAAGLLKISRFALINRVKKFNLTQEVKGV
jgi:two-component system NtrC family response regulator